jgi:hypothetical protein
MLIEGWDYKIFESSPEMLAKDALRVKYPSISKVECIDITKKYVDVIVNWKMSELKSIQLVTRNVDKKYVYRTLLADVDLLVKMLGSDENV